MRRWLRRKDGKFAGSVGDGKDQVPTAGSPLPPWHRDPDPSASMEMHGQYRAQQMQMASFRERHAMADLMRELGDDNPEWTHTQWGPQNGDDVRRVVAVAERVAADPGCDAEKRRRIVQWVEDAELSHTELVLARSEGGNLSDLDREELEHAVQRGEVVSARQAAIVRERFEALGGTVTAGEEGDRDAVARKAENYFHGMAEARAWRKVPAGAPHALFVAIKQYERRAKVTRSAADRLTLS